MTTTPWGDAAELRSRRLRPGPGTPRETVVSNQRSRLFAALVAEVSERGYHATRVKDVTDRSGLSGSTFYKHFADKQACMIAAMETLVDGTMEQVASAFAEEGSWDERARRALRTFGELVAGQPAAARLCMIEPYAAGDEAIGCAERALRVFEGLVRETLQESPERAGMPDEVIRGFVGGIWRIVHARLRHRQEDQLPGLMEDLWEWGLAYRNPPTPLRRPRKALAPDQRPTWTPNDQAERILAGLLDTVAGKGYQSTTVADIVAAAATSTRAFYAHFADKEDAFLAALDVGQTQAMAAAAPAFRRGGDWPQAVRGGLQALFAFVARETPSAVAMIVEAHAVGPKALDRRDEALAAYQAFLAEGYRVAPDTPTIAVEAIGEAIDTLLYDAVRAGGGPRVTALVPTATYLALTPFLGSATACQIANENGGGRVVASRRRSLPG